VVLLLLLLLLVWKTAAWYPKSCHDNLWFYFPTFDNCPASGHCPNSSPRESQLITAIIEKSNTRFFCMYPVLSLFPMNNKMTAGSFTKPPGGSKVWSLWNTWFFDAEDYCFLKYMEPAVSSMLESTPFQNTWNRWWCFDPYLLENGGLLKSWHRLHHVHYLPTTHWRLPTYLSTYRPTPNLDTTYLPTNPIKVLVRFVLLFASCWLGPSRGGGGPSSQSRITASSTWTPISL